MFRLFQYKAKGLAIVIFLLGLFVNVSNAQVYTKPVSPKPTPTPFFQDIVIQPTNKTNPNPSPTPLINKTASVTPKADIVNPAAVEMTIPGYSGVLIETLDGKVVKESYSNYAFNPASNVKVAPLSLF